MVETVRSGVHGGQNNGAILLLEQLKLVGSRRRSGRCRRFRLAVEDEAHGAGTETEAIVVLVVEDLAELDGALEMRGHVTLAVTGSSESEIAVRAFKGFGAGVEAHVDLETAAGSEEGAADVAANVFGRRVVSPRVRV